MNEDDLDEDLPCSRCGLPMVQPRPSFAYLTTKDGCQQVPIPAGPPFCPDEDCRAEGRRKHNELVVQDAIDRGVIVREHPPGYDDQFTTTEETP